jgi:riboflavin kinase / FMN adenylyltransferase
MNSPFRQFADTGSLPADLRGGAIAIGNFDGVHRGHAALLAATRGWAARHGRPALLLTFEPHPRAFFRPFPPLFRLTSPEMKARRVAGHGIDAMVSCPFNGDLASHSAEAFCRELLGEALGAAHVVTGEDFQFGKGRGGDAGVLAAHGRTLGFSTEAVPAVIDTGMAISSTRIRALLENGDIRGANGLLGWEWSVAAEVLHGDKRGRQLGYPTANLTLDPAIALAHGIYAVRATVDGRTLGAVASFGRRPTFDGGAPKLEVHIFDFEEDLYGKILEVAFIGHIRPELRFDSVDALIARMDMDSMTARKMLA